MTNQTFPLFPSFPLEIRLKIWELALPGPRVLHVLPSGSTNALVQQGVCAPLRSSQYLVKCPENFTVSPHSYGVYHPAILSVNGESREVVLRKLTLLWGVYWNLAIDVPYFEIKYYDNEDTLLLTLMAQKGVLAPFKHIAIDSKLFMWHIALTMEFKTCMHGRFNGFIEPARLLAAELKHVEKSTIVYTKHDERKDLSVAYCPWSLGQVSEETTLDADLQTKRDFYQNPNKTELQYYTDTFMVQWRELIGKDLTLEFAAIHDRKREDLPEHSRQRPIQGWEMDWFG